MASGLRDSTSVLGSRVCSLIFGIAMQSCLAWFLGPAGRGSYAVCLMFATLMSLVFVVGCDSASVYFIAAKKFTLSDGVINTVVYGLIGSALAIIIGLFIIGMPLEFVRKASAIEFRFALASIPFSLFGLIFLRILTALRDFKYFAILSISVAFLQLITTVLFVSILDLGIVGAFYAIISANSIVILASLVVMVSKHGLRFSKPSIFSLKQMFSYGFRFYIGRIGNTVNFQIGTIVLAFFMGEQEIGWFAVASQLITRVIMIPDSLITVLLPRVAEDKLGKPDIVALCSRLSACLCGMVLLFICVFAELIVKVLFSSEFMPSVLLIRILSIGVFFRCACKVFESYFLGTDRPGKVSIAVGISTITNLLGLTFLLPKIGLYGAPVAVTCGYIFSSIFLTCSFIKFSGLGLVDIFHYKKADFKFIIKPLLEKIR